MPFNPPSRKNGALLDLVNIINLVKWQKKQMGKYNTRISPVEYESASGSHNTTSVNVTEDVCGFLQLWLRKKQLKLASSIIIIRDFAVVSFYNHCR